MNRFLVLVAFVLIGISAQVYSAETYAFPNPYRANVNPNITFTNLPGSGTIEIYSISGEKVAQLSIAPGELSKQWNATNDDGEKLASGVYIYIVQAGGQTSQGKIIVIT
ncbi:MAG: T9SS type A sorting domain-containing protein [Elusimicrobiota bacterium]